MQSMIVLSTSIIFHTISSTMHVYNLTQMNSLNNCMNAWVLLYSNPDHLNVTWRTVYAASNLRSVVEGEGSSCRVFRASPVAVINLQSSVACSTDWVFSSSLVHHFSLEIKAIWHWTLASVWDTNWRVGTSLAGEEGSTRFKWDVSDGCLGMVEWVIAGLVRMPVRLVSVHIVMMSCSAGVVVSFTVSRVWPVQTMGTILLTDSVVVVTALSEVGEGTCVLFIACPEPEEKWFVNTPRRKLSH